MNKYLREIIAVLLLTSACSDTTPGSDKSDSMDDSESASANDDSEGLDDSESASDDNGSDSDTSVDQKNYAANVMCEVDADCPGVDATCVVFPDEDGEWHDCSTPYPEATTSSPNYPENDECISSADCNDNALCFYVKTDFGPSSSDDWNRCLENECQTDDDCPNPQSQMCFPAGLGYHPTSRCIDVQCKSNADCTDEENGICAILYRPGLWGTSLNRIAGKFCNYETAQCMLDSDCPADKPICSPTDSPSDGFQCISVYSPGE